MDAILKHLKQQVIISPKDIENLQHTLRCQYPEHSNHERAELFAKALHRTLNDALRPFEGSALKTLKGTLIKQTLQKKDFSIDAFDIFEICAQTESIDPAHLSTLTTWLNHYHPQILSIDEVSALATTFISKRELSSELPCPPTMMPLTISSLLKQNKKLFFTSALVFLVISCFIIKSTTYYLPPLTEQPSDFYLGTLVNVTLPLDTLAPATSEKLDNGLQEALQYKSVDQKSLKLWLQERDSLLATEPYFSTIILTAQSFNVNPLVLFAITGQEQNFVPTTNEHAKEIANNPFNLYGSWKAFNTSIEEAAQIVSRTIINLGANCPDDSDPIKWINRSYAEDPNWHVGVNYFLDELEAASTLSLQ